MTAKIIPFTGVTSLDLDPNNVLEAAKDELEGVVVLGFKKDGNGLHFSSSYADGGTVIWLMEKLKLNLLTGVHED